MTVRTLQSAVVADGFAYGEGPRWRDGKLWFSDMHADAVRTLDADGTLALGASAHHPSGIGWTADGELLVTSLENAVLSRITANGPVVHCDLSELGLSLNDMVATPGGRVYVDIYTERGAGAPIGDIALVTPDGTARIVASGLVTPNGLAVTPDGICLDVEGGVWVGCFVSGEFLRLLECGEITDRVPTGDSWAVAPALGGPEMRTLHLVINDTTFMGIATGDSTGRIETVEVDVPGAGSP